MGAGKIAQSVTGLPNKFNAQNTHKETGMVYEPRLKKKSDVTVWPYNPIPDYLASPRPMRYSVSINKVDERLLKNTHTPSLSPSL